MILYSQYVDLGGGKLNAKELKEYINQDTQRIFKILEGGGCHHLWNNDSNDEIRGAVPDGDNKTALVVKRGKQLFTTIYDPSYNFTGDIIGAVQKLKHLSFRDTIVLIHSYLGLSISATTSKKHKDPLELLKPFVHGRHGSCITNKRNKLYGEHKLNRFIPSLHKNIIEEGISPKVAHTFRVCYDPEKSRIIFPHYDWIEYDKIVGIKGRTTLDGDVAKELNVPKYWNYIKGYQKTLNLYGYNFSKENIDKTKMIILFEAEKSVMKQFTFTRGKGFSVALGGHSISDEQVRFILSHTANDVEVVFAYDKDVQINTELDTGEKYIGRDYLKSQCKKFMGLRKTSYIYDKYDLLAEKSSPIDETIKKWNYLLKWRVSL